MRSRLPDQLPEPRAGRGRVNADQAYRWLMGAGAPSAGDGFDRHVFAAILSLAIGQSADQGMSLAATTGLDPVGMAGLASVLFPSAGRELAELAAGEAPRVGVEEQSVRDILLMYASGPAALMRPLVALIARRCNEPHHLWQDLGLRDRGELSTLMQRHFSRLKERNQGDMKWKKFLYRMVCATEGFTLCPAPVCSECDDFSSCFGSEEGVAQLTHSYTEDLRATAFRKD